MSDPVPPLGRVVATELKPSTPHQFHFWTARETPIGIGAIVRVEEGERVVYGVVTDGFAYSDLVTPMHAVIGADGDPVAAGLEPSQRAEIRLFTAAVLRQMPEEPLQPVPLGRGLARHRCRRRARPPDGRLHRRRAAPPASRSASTRPAGSSRPVYLDCDFLLGPEAAHLNITGVSGLATKTSAVEFLLGSIFQTFPAHKGSVAALCFNVKGPDLCFLDQPADADRGGPAAVRPARPPARALRRRALLRPVQGRRRQPQHPPDPRGARRQHRSRWSGGCARCSTTPRWCSTATTWTPRPTPSSISSPSGWWAGSTRTTCCAASRFRCRASPTWRSSSARSSISWRCWARAGRCGRPTTSRPSGRSGTG